MSIKVVWRGKRYNEGDKHDWQVDTFWGSRRLSRYVEKGKTAREVSGSLRAIQRRTPRVEYDFILKQLPKKRLKRVM